MPSPSRPWVLPSILLAAALAGTGCTPRCKSDRDCGAGEYCGASDVCQQDCITDEDCAAFGTTSCQYGRCQVRAGSVYDGITQPKLPETITEGWDAEPFTGKLFIVDALRIAPRGVGFNLDGKPCGGGSCADNLVADLGPHANEHIDSGVTSGATLLLMEVVGLEDGFDGNDLSATIKFYTAKDADVPPQPLNNFDGSECCKFHVLASSLGADGQSIARAGVRIQSFRIHPVRSFSLRFALVISEGDVRELTIDRARISGRLDRSLTTLSEGLLGGAVSAASLAAIPNPYCNVLSSLCQGRSSPTLLELLAPGIQPDIDTDDDGLEQITGGADGLISGCTDRRGRPIPPVFADRPESCALALDDGYSTTFQLSAVPAAVLGIIE